MFNDNIINDYDAKIIEVNKFRKKTFGDLGGNAELIMDIVDDCVNENVIRYKALLPNQRESVPFNHLLFHITTNIRREFSQNYSKKYKTLLLPTNGLKIVIYRIYY